MMKISSVVTFLLFSTVSFSQIVPNCVIEASSITNVFPSSSIPGRITLSWTPVSRAPFLSSYSASFVYEYRVTAGTWNFVAAGNAVSAQIDLVPATNYEFVIRTDADCVETNGAQDTDHIESVAVPALTYPSSPTLDENGSRASALSMSINFLWTAVPGVVSGYDIEVSNAGGLVLTQSIMGTAFLASGLLPGTNYFYRVRAKNATGPSPYTTLSAAILTRTGAPVANGASNITANSFTANWQSPTGAVSYQLDVSTDNYFTFLTNYNSLTVNGTSIAVTGLNAGTPYSYRVRAVNGSGVSANSSSISLITLPLAPAVNFAANITTTSFTAIWQAVTGAASYRLDVSTDNFATFLTGYNDLTVSGTSPAVTGLNAGSSYSYRARAVNGSGVSANSSSVSLITLPLPPAANSATNVTANSFSDNWQAVMGAVSYQLDVSADNFATFLTSYNNLPVIGTTQVVSGLNAGTIYNYRIRAVNANGGISNNSANSSQLTLPDSPLNFTTSDNQATNIKVNWSAVISATEYHLQVSSSQTFSNLLTGYDPRIIALGFTSFIVTNLTPSTVYYFRIFASNSTGLSDYSAQTSSTLNADGSSTAISFNTLQYPLVHVAGQQQDISTTISGGIGPLIVDFYHKKNSELNFVKASTVLNGTYKLSTQDDWFDSFGMEFYFEAHDLANQVKQKKDDTNQPFKVLNSVSEVVVPVTSFGREVRDYQIISIPYQLPGRPQVHDAFEQVTGLGEYDKKKWRLFHYQDGKNVEYSDGVKASDLAQGQSYWFISKDEITLSLGQGKSFGNSSSKPFTLNLKKGWNQIGNPFPYDLSWADVLAVSANTSATVENDFLVFNKESVSFTRNDLLPVFGGGFVFANSDTQLTFPVTLVAKGGRVGTDGGKIDANPLNDSYKGNWILPITLAQGEVTNTLSGIGMNADAADAKDKYDRVAPPRFLRYAEFNSRQPNFAYDLSQDIVSPKENFKWNFTIETNSIEVVELKWDKQMAAALAAQLILYDQTKQVLLDMAKLSTYSTVSGANISIYFRKSAQMEVVQIELGRPYPNPFQTEITIPYHYSIDEPSQAEFTVYDLTGRILVQKTINAGNDQLGIQLFKWNGTTHLGKEVESGMYLFKVQVNQGRETWSYNGKIIKQ